MKQTTPHPITVTVSTKTLRYLRSYRSFAICAERHGLEDPRTGKIFRRCFALQKLCPAHEATMLDELRDWVTSSRKVIITSVAQTLLPVPLY